MQINVRIWLVNSSYFSGPSHDCFRRRRHDICSLHINIWPCIVLLEKNGQRQTRWIGLFPPTERKPAQVPYYKGFRSNYMQLNWEMWECMYSWGLVYSCYISTHKREAAKYLQDMTVIWSNVISAMSPHQWHQNSCPLVFTYINSLDKISNGLIEQWWYIK